MRYTDRDCKAALIRLAHAMREHGHNVGVLRDLGEAEKPLAELANRLGVPLVYYGDPMDHLALDHAPGCYGGGVRPALYRDGGSGQYTPEWWHPSAGLGPGAVPRKQFVLIVDAVASGLHIARSEARKEER